MAKAILNFHFDYWHTSLMVVNDHGVIVAILNFAALNLDLGQPVKSCEMLSALRDDV